MEYFSDFPRTNPISKIFHLFQLICSDLKNDIFYTKKKVFMKEFNKLSQEEELSNLSSKVE